MNSKQYSSKSYKWKRTCLHCKKEFWWQTKQGGIPGCCSETCRYSRELALNRSYGDRHTEESKLRWKNSPKRKAYMKKYLREYYLKHRVLKRRIPNRDWQSNYFNSLTARNYATQSVETS